MESGCWVGPVFDHWGKGASGYVFTSPGWSHRIELPGILEGSGGVHLSNTSSETDSLSFPPHFLFLTPLFTCASAYLT